MRILWEVQKYRLDGDGYCDDDMSVFAQIYGDEAPCARIIDYAPSAEGEDSVPFFIDVNGDGALFMNHNVSVGYTYESCIDPPGEVLYSAQGKLGAPRFDFEKKSHRGL